MKFEWIKTPKIISKIFSNYHWSYNPAGNSVYITFDDGPIPEITPWVLRQLEQYDAKATFFCIGDNIQKHPEIFRQIIKSGHSIGNHTHNHRNGWSTTKQEYIQNTQVCQETIDVALKGLKTSNNTSLLFRPPYGKIKPSQSVLLRERGYKIIMWDVLSVDYKASVSKEKCLANVLENIEAGSIIVFHDSLKAFPRLEYVLPKTLEFLKKNNYNCKAII